MGFPSKGKQKEEAMRGLIPKRAEKSITMMIL